VLSEIRYSARKYIRTPGVTLALLSTIALGIGSNVSIYGFARGLTEPHSSLGSASRMVSIFERDSHGEAGPVSYEEYLRLKHNPNAFEWIGAARVSPVNVMIADQSAVLSVAALTPKLARALSLSTGKGGFVSYRIWQSEFGGKADVRGQQIRIDRVNTRVSGFAPSWLEGLYRDRAVDIWVPLEEKSLHEADRHTRNVWVLARLRRGISISEAQNSVRPIEVSEPLAVLPYSGMTPEMAGGMSRIGTLFRLAAGAVFFIACANVISFLLGRGFARSHETSVRVALGASRAQLAGELLWDSIAISIAGGAFGILLATWTVHVIPVLLFEEDAERLVFAPGLLSIVTAAATCVGITILCGLVPALASPSNRPESVLRQESAGPSKAMVRLRASLAIAQMTSCCVLLVSTVLLLDSLRVALQTSTSGRAGDPILITVQKQPSPDSGITYFRQVQQAAESMAGISGMAWAGQLPGSQPIWQSFRIDPPHLPLRDVTLNIAAFTADSLRLFQLPPRDGRLFGFEDQTCRVAIANEQAAAELFGRQTVGRTIQEYTGPPVEIIGVVADKSHTASHPTIYYNHTDQIRLPLDRVATARFRAAIPSELARVELDANVVSQSYFDMMGLSLIAGRWFGEHPISGECRAAVINREAAELYFNGNAVGAAVIDDRGVRTPIVGVVRSRAFGSFQRHPEPAIYFPMRQDCLPRMTLIARARQVKDAVLLDLRRRIESVPGHGPAPVAIQTLAAHLSHTALAPLRIATVIIGASATTALMLSILGLFGTLNDAARQRRRELSIRVALGAQRWHVVYQVLREGGRLAATGALLGTLGSLALSRLLAPLIPGNRLPALWVWLAAPLVLALAVVIASVLPARRAVMANPVTIMREEN